MSHVSIEKVREVIALHEESKYHMEIASPLGIMRCSVHQFINGVLKSKVFRGD